jgi:hypothetical protein
MQNLILDFNFIGRTLLIITKKKERKTAIEFMATYRSRVAITTDVWTSDNQKKGYYHSPPY